MIPMVAGSNPVLPIQRPFLKEWSLFYLHYRLTWCLCITLISLSATGTVQFSIFSIIKYV